MVPLSKPTLEQLSKYFQIYVIEILKRKCVYVLLSQNIKEWENIVEEGQGPCYNEGIVRPSSWYRKMGNNT